MFTTISLVAISAAASAYAADVNQPPQLQEIVVTAEKSSTNLQKTPISVSTISGEALAAANITSIDTLNGRIPGLVVNIVGAGYVPAVSVRGLGYSGLQNNSAQPGVSLNQDGVYIASPLGLNSDYLDLAQIEVLRGPQAAVLGQNSDGGAINITTTRPILGKVDGLGEAAYGSYNLFNVKAAVNMPVGDNVAVRLAAQHLEHDGWSVATKIPGHPNFPLSNANSETGRATILWQPTSQLSVTAWGEVFRSTANGSAQKNLFDPNPDPRLLTQDYPSKMPSGSEIGALDLHYDFGAVRARSISSYQHSYQGPGPVSIDYLDFDTAFNLYGIHALQPITQRDTKTFTQEITLASHPGGAFEWILGAFYVHSRFNIGYTVFNTTTRNASPPGLLDFTAADLGSLYAQGFAFGDVGRQIHKSGSLYGQGTYHVTDKLTLIGGLRYTRDRSKGRDSVSFAAPTYTATGYNRVTGKGTVQYAMTPSNSVYAMGSVGIKPGGTNVNPGALVIPGVYAPETVTAAELGSKNEFLDRRLRVNVAAFYNWIRNYQLDSEDPLPFHGGLTNAARAHTYGVEVEFSALITDHLSLDGNLASLRGKIDSDSAFLDPATGQALDREFGVFSAGDIGGRFAAYQSLKGKELPNVPKFSGSVGLGHRLDVGEIGGLTSRIMYTFRSRYEARPFNNPNLDHVPWLHQLDLSFTYNPKHGAWYVGFQVINVANSDSVATRFTDNFGTGATTNYYVPPRQFIGRVGAKF